MKLHAGLKYSTIFKRIEKETGRKFMIDQYDTIYEYDKKDECWKFYTKAFLNTNITKQEKQDFIDNL